MEVSYRRDFNHNYMILEKDGVTGEEYMIRMMEQNHIPELLKLQVRKMNGKTYLYYEITSRQPVVQIYENRRMKSKDIRRLLTGIRDGINRARQYLLNSGDILLDPEYIYMDVDTRQVQLCYVPYSGQGEYTLLKLAEFVLKRLDHGEQQAVELGYKLFHQASQENVSFSDLVQTLLRESGERPYGKAEGDSGKGREFGRSEKYLENYSERYSNKYPEKYPEGNGWKTREADDANPLEEKRSRKKTEERAPGKKKQEKRGKTKKKEQRREREDKGKGRKKGWLIGSLTAAAALLIFGAVVYVAKLDLTQTGGLAFLLLAIVWIVYGTVTGKQEAPKKNWIEDDFEEEEEAFFLNELFPETKDRKEMESEKDRENPRGLGWRETWEADGKMKGRYEGETEEEDALEGETRCLTETEKGKSFRLVSMEADQYGDIVMDQEKLLIGKKKDQVDIWIRDASVSRLHARLERDQGICFVTDLNSRNGTYVGGERLMPNEKRALRDGDKVSFAARHYRMKITEF